jgi:hypothetical protein
MKLSDYEIEEQYKDMLDECYPPIKFGDMEYSPSYALYNLDPIAYRVGLSDYEATTECADCDEVLSDCTCEEEELCGACGQYDTKGAHDCEEAYV